MDITRTVEWQAPQKRPLRRRVAVGKTFSRLVLRCWARLVEESSNGDTATQRGTNPAATQRRGVVLGWATGVRRFRGGHHPDSGMASSPKKAAASPRRCWKNVLTAGLRCWARLVKESSNGDTATQRGTNPAATQRRGVVLGWATGVRRFRGGHHPDGGMESSPKKAAASPRRCWEKALAARAPLLGKALGGIFQRRHGDTARDQPSGDAATRRGSGLGDGCAEASWWRPPGRWNGKLPKKGRCVAASLLEKRSHGWCSAAGQGSWRNLPTATRRHSAGPTQRRRGDAAWFWGGRRVCGGSGVDITRTVEWQAPQKRPLRRRVAVGRRLSLLVLRCWARLVEESSNGDTATQRGTNPAATRRRGVVLGWATGVRRRRGGDHPDGGMESSPKKAAASPRRCWKNVLTAGAPLLGKARGGIFQRRHGDTARDQPNGDAATRRGSGLGDGCAEASWWRPPGRWDGRLPKERRCVAASLLGEGSRCWCSAAGQGSWRNLPTATRRHSAGPTQRRRGVVLGWATGVRRRRRGDHPDGGMVGSPKKGAVSPRRCWKKVLTAGLRPGRDQLASSSAG